MFDFRRQRTDSTYLRSQSATGSPIHATEGIITLTLAMLSLGDDPRARQRAAQTLIDELNAVAKLGPCEIIVADRRQVHSHDGQRLTSKTYGYYRCWFQGKKVSRARIRIYNRTAVREQVITPKVFLNTLLHEWTHHYDFAGLQLQRSPHTAGFFTRLRNLAEELHVGMVVPSSEGVKVSVNPSRIVP